MLVSLLTVALAAAQSEYIPQLTTIYGCTDGKPSPQAIVLYSKSNFIAGSIAELAEDYDIVPMLSQTKTHIVIVMDCQGQYVGTKIIP